jgi:hypothetical protein
MRGQGLERPGDGVAALIYIGILGEFVFLGGLGEILHFATGRAN